MFTSDDATAVASRPADRSPGTQAWYTEGSPGVTPATVVRYDWLNMIQAELKAVVTAGGLTPTKGTDDQLLQAIRLLVAQTAGFPGQIGGLEMTNTAGFLTTHIDFAAGMAMSADATTLLRAAAMTKQLSGVPTWAAGNNQPGRAGTLTANTWYHCFVVNKSDGGVDFGFDASPTATILLGLTGGTKYRMIGSILTAPAATTILAFKQRGNFIQWDTPTLDFPPSPWTQEVPNTETLIALKSPPDVRAIVKVRVEQEAGTQLWMLIRSPDEANVAPTAIGGTSILGPLRTLWDNGGGSNTLNATLDIYTNTSKQIAARSNAAGGVRLDVVTVGFEHPRGRW